MKSGNISVLRKTFSLVWKSFLYSVSTGIFASLLFHDSMTGSKNQPLPWYTRGDVWEDWFFCLYFDVLLFSSRKHSPRNQSLLDARPVEALTTVSAVGSVSFPFAATPAPHEFSGPWGPGAVSHSPSQHSAQTWTWICETDWCLVLPLLLIHPTAPLRTPTLTILSLSWCSSAEHAPTPASSRSQATVRKMLLSSCSFAQKCSMLPTPHTVNSVIWRVFRGLYETSATHSPRLHPTLPGHPSSFNPAALFADSSAFLASRLALAIAPACLARSPSLIIFCPSLKAYSSLY